LHDDNNRASSANGADVLTKFFKPRIPALPQLALLPKAAPLNLAPAAESLSGRRKEAAVLWLIDTLCMAVDE
jgi:hypothetical protein